ncbi:MAG: hypothetical protein ACYTDW_01925 [Planctomycetota bacterium]|jgi:hypothetical protein
MPKIPEIDIKDTNVALINDEIIPQLAEIVPAGKKALELYATKAVDEGMVAGIVFDLYVDLYSGDMMEPVADACDALLIKFEESIEEWAREKAKGLIEKSQIVAIVSKKGGLWEGLIDGDVIRISCEDSLYAYFDIKKKEGQLKSILDPIVDEYGSNREDVLALWRECHDYGDSIEELKSPILIRRKQLADVRSALKIKLKAPYSCPYEWRSVAQVMEALNWLKELKEGGYEVQMTWQHFYDFLHGYQRDEQTYTKGSIFGDSGLLSDLPDLFKEKYWGLVALWNVLAADVKTFNNEINEWKTPTNSERPESYKDLKEKLTGLYEHMQIKRRTFEGYLPLSILTLPEVLTRTIIQASKPRFEDIEGQISRNRKYFDSELQGIRDKIKKLQPPDGGPTKQSGS